MFVEPAKRLSRLLDEFSAPARLPHCNRPRLQNIEPIFPMCSIVCDSDDPEVLRVERLCAQYSLRLLDRLGIEVACDLYRSQLWTEMHLARDREKDFCVISLQTHVVIHVGEDPGRTSIIRFPFRSIRLAAATKPCSLWRDVRLLLNFQLKEFVAKYRRSRNFISI